MLAEDWVFAISIHASAKEATETPTTPTLATTISIHASAKEATHIILTHPSQNLFQSTPPRRRRLLLSTILNIA